MSFQIVKLQKKGGGHRTVYAPDEPLGAALRQRLPELNRLQSRRCEYAHGFMPGRSAVTGALRHCGYRHTACWDLRSFFDHVTRAQIEAVVQLDWLDEALIDGAPRQGLPTSPGLANLAAVPLDSAIVEWLDGRGVYTRYADDLTVSTDDQAVLDEALIQIPRLVEAAGWVIHPGKTRIQHARAGRRVICGVAVGDERGKSWATRRTRRRLRAAQHTADTSASARRRREAGAQARGLAEWCRQRPPAAYPLDLAGRLLRCLEEPADGAVPAAPAHVQRRLIDCLDEADSPADIEARRAVEAQRRADELSAAQLDEAAAERRRQMEAWRKLEAEADRLARNARALGYRHQSAWERAVAAHLSAAWCRAEISL